MRPVMVKLNVVSWLYDLFWCGWVGVYLCLHCWNLCF
uniref:Uncharacterized protein n=1 Tax=Arundo donax TaxID=35708 RepID=A0A0A9GRQ6_ARUDO